MAQAVAVRSQPTKKKYPDMSHLLLKRLPDISKLTPGAQHNRRNNPYEAVAERAPTSRSICKACGLNIPKDVLRLTLLLQCHRGYKMPCTLHEECFWRHPETRKLESLREIGKGNGMSREIWERIVGRFEAMKSDVVSGNGEITEDREKREPGIEEGGEKNGRQPERKESTDIPQSPASESTPASRAGGDEPLTEQPHTVVESPSATILTADSASTHGIAPRGEIRASTEHSVPEKPDSDHTSDGTLPRDRASRLHGSPGEGEKSRQSPSPSPSSPSSSSPSSSFPSPSSSSSQESHKAKESEGSKKRTAEEQQEHGKEEVVVDGEPHVDQESLAKRVRREC